MRRLGKPFVVVPPVGVRVRTRLLVDDRDVEVLAELGAYLGRLAGRDLAVRCRSGGANNRTERKRILTGEASSRWAGTITRASQEQWQTGLRNLRAERASLQRRIRTIQTRLAAPVGSRVGRALGYPNQAERFQKQQRLARLQHRVSLVEERLATQRVSVVRGGRRLARARHHLVESGRTEDGWRQRWEAGRWFISADGEARKRLGNETIRFDPDAETLEIRLPTGLAHLANRPRCRYRLSGTVRFPYRGDEVAAQAMSGAVRYDVRFDAGRGRWYLDASWTRKASPVPGIEEMTARGVVAVDLNADHLAAWVLDPAGNPRGQPQSIPLVCDGLSSKTRDARIRAAISALIRLAERSGAGAIAIEDLGFADVFAGGREKMGRGQRGRRFRRIVHGLPTGRLRDRLVQMAANRGLWVIAVDPAYTSRWGSRHWYLPLSQQTAPSVTVTRHHAAAVVIGRRSLGHGARRRPGVTDPHRRMGRGELPARPARRDEAVRNGGPRQALRQRRDPCETGRAERARSPDQATQDRSGPPAEPSPRLAAPAHRSGQEVGSSCR